MFQSEQLQEKWAPLLNHEGLDSIQDSHKRAVTAVLLENQEKFLREQNAFSNSGSFLAEDPTNSAGTGGFTNGAAAGGPVAGFDPVQLGNARLNATCSTGTIHASDTKTQVSLCGCHD